MTVNHCSNKQDTQEGYNIDELIDFGRNKAAYRALCSKRAHEFLQKERGMSTEDAKAFLKRSVSWKMRDVSISWEDRWEADDAELTAMFNFGKRSCCVSLEYYARRKAFSSHLFVSFTSDFGDIITTTVSDYSTLLLTADNVRRAMQTYFPDDWPPENTLEFIYICMGAGGLCPYIQTADGLVSDTVKLCSKLDGVKCADN